MIEKWVIFKRDYLEISFLRENCGYDGSDERRRNGAHFDKPDIIAEYMCAILIGHTTYV